MAEIKIDIDIEKKADSETIVSVKDTEKIIDIEHTVNEELEYFITLRKNWRTIGMVMEGISKFMLGTTSILSFCISIYPCNTYLSITSGCFATASLVSLQFANYSFRESKLSTLNINKLLLRLDKKPIPDLNGSVLKQSNSQISQTDMVQI